MTETKNDSPPTLSICVPTFQREKWIAGLLDQIDRELHNIAVGRLPLCRASKHCEFVAGRSRPSEANQSRLIAN